MTVIEVSVCVYVNTVINAYDEMKTGPRFLHCKDSSWKYQFHAMCPYSSHDKRNRQITGTTWSWIPYAKASRNTVPGYAHGLLRCGASSVLWGSCRLYEGFTSLVLKFMGSTSSVVWARTLNTSELTSRLSRLHAPRGSVPPLPKVSLMSLEEGRRRFSVAVCPSDIDNVVSGYLITGDSDRLGRGSPVRVKKFWLSGLSLV